MYILVGKCLVDKEIKRMGEDEFRVDFKVDVIFYNVWKINKIFYVGIDIDLFGILGG